MQFNNKPDPRVDWDNIKYTSSSDAIRPEPGYRYCTSCWMLYAVNHWNFSRNRNTPDGYNYHCKKCAREYQRNKGLISPTSCEGENPTPEQKF